MRKPCILLARFCVLTLLASCAPLSLYHRDGGSVARMQSDLLTCEVASLRDAPVATQIRQGPPQYIPARRYCDRSGHCYARGGGFTSGDVYTVDTNAQLRGKLEAQCMGNKGYKPVTLPRCASDIARAAPTRVTQILPSLTPDSCAIKKRDGTWQIENPIR